VHVTGDVPPIEVDPIDLVRRVAFMLPIAELALKENVGSKARQASRMGKIKYEVRFYSSTHGFADIDPRDRITVGHKAIAFDERPTLAAPYSSVTCAGAQN
jgi:hypothetical protein